MDRGGYSKLLLLQFSLIWLTVFVKKPAIPDSVSWVAKGAVSFLHISENHNQFFCQWVPKSKAVALNFIFIHAIHSQALEIKLLPLCQNHSFTVSTNTYSFLHPMGVFSGLGPLNTLDDLILLIVSSLLPVALFLGAPSSM